MRGKKPLKRDKILLRYWRLNPANWLVQKRYSDKLQLVHRHTGKERIVPIRENITEYKSCP